MLKSRLLAGVTAALLMCSLRAQADSETVQADDVSGDALVIDGDKLELHLDRKMRALGNASITRGKQTVLGDVIDYDVQNDELHVVGNARINVGNGNITGPELHMRLSEGIGEMKNASIVLLKTAEPNVPQLAAASSETFSKKLGNLQNQQIGNESLLPAIDLSILNNASITDVIQLDSSQSATQNTKALTEKSLLASTESRGDAKAVLFEGQDTKRLIDARYTTCPAGVDDWYIKAKELVLNEYSESAVATNAYIEFKGVPFLYTPWISFSYNNQRKSGLLAPTIGSTSRSGLEVSTPFYWNIAPNMDATLATRVLSKRGVQMQGEFRYLEDSFSGIDNVEYLPNDNQTESTRYYANLKHQQTFGNGWSAGYSLEKVSDNQYFADLSTRIVTTSRINLPQQFNVDYADDNWNFNALAQKFQTLDDLSFPYERLPQLTLNGGKEYGPVDTNLYAQLVAFDTNVNAPVKPTGTRFTLYPSISLPMTQSYGYITPKFGVHHTSYSLDNIASNLETQERTLPIFSIDSGLFFDRNFKVADRDYSQTIEPRMYYVYIPESKQSNIPIFDTSEADLNFSTLFSENQFTGNDRINNANQLSLALTTRLIESSTGTQRLSLSVGQRYYFADQVVALPGVDFRKNNSSDIIAGLSANLKSSWNLDAFWQYNTDDARSVRTSVTSRYNPEPGKALNLGYSYRRDVTGTAGIDQFDVSAQWPLGKGWYGVGRVNYSLRENQNIETLAGIEYDAGCWQTRSVIQRVSTATANANYAIFFQLELGGLASIGANPLNVIKRNIPGYVSTGLIPDTYQQPYYE
ncbi:MAG: LPS-assembly protein LptD [Bacteroidia bacterium]|nr:LPS-assembly protein LptD [Methylotenera sp.]